MRRHHGVQFILAAASVLLGVSSASPAATVNVQLGSSGTSAFTGQGAAVTSDTTPFWNLEQTGADFANPSTITNAALKDSSGAASGITFSATNTAHSQVNKGSSNGSNGLLASEWYTNNQTSSIVLGGLQSAQPYSLYLYGVDGPASSTSGPQGASFTVTGLVTSTAQSTAGTPATPYSTPGNYVVFTNVLPSATNTITVSWTAGTNTGESTQYGIFNGIQVVAAPEPASLGLLGVSALFLLRRRAR